MADDDDTVLDQPRSMPVPDLPRPNWARGSTEMPMPLPPQRPGGPDYPLPTVSDAIRAQYKPLPDDAPAAGNPRPDYDFAGASGPVASVAQPFGPMNQPPAAGDALASSASPGAPVPPDRDALRAQFGDPMAEDRAAREERHRILGPMLAGVQQSGADLSAAARNSPKPPSPGPEPQRGMGMQAAGNWIMFASALGMLAGGMTKRHSMNAMAAFSGALEGVQQGNKQAFEQNKTIWEEENKRAAQAYQQQRDAYNDIINNKKLDYQTRMLVFEQTAKMLGDDATATAAARRDERLINEVILKQNDAYERAKQEYLKLEGKTLQEGIKAGIAGPEDASRYLQKIGGSPLTGGTAADPDSQARAISEYRQAPYSGASARSPRGQAIMDRVYAFNPDYDARRYNASNRAEINFGTGQEGRSLRAIQVADNHLQTLAQLGDAMQNKNIRLVNQIRNFWKEQTGEELPAGFTAAKQVVAAEVVKAVAASGGGVTERLEAAKNIDKQSSPRELHRVIQTYRQLLAGQREGFKGQYESATGKTDFDKRFPVPVGFSATAGPPITSAPPATKSPRSQPLAKPPPPVGYVEDGYRYKGGPADQETSWEKVK